MNIKVNVVSGLLFTALAVLASQSQAAGTEKKKSLEQIKASITAGIKIARPTIEVDTVEESPIAGLYKVSFQGAKDIYSSADGMHFITGDVFEVRPGEIINLTEFGRNDERKKAMAGIDKKDMITFSPKGEVKQKVYVFTDIDCGYCQLLHSKMAEYNDLGIEVSYLGYPRAGVNSNSFNKLASAWCAKDPQDAITKLKQKQEIPDNICAENPIAAQYELGGRLGLTGTPALVLESGELISGYLPPDRMKQRLNL